MATTTDAALQAGSGEFGFVLLIEGFSYLITDAASTSAVVTAYAASDWSAAIPGLKVLGGIKQSIEPFKPDLDIPELSFAILDWDGNDTLGKAIWKTKPAIQSRLNAVFTPAADGSGTVTVRDNSAFASSGTIYVGTKRMNYSAKSGSTGFTIGAGGANTFASLDADTGKTYAWPNGLSGGIGGDVGVAPRVSDVPATWIGKKVALYIHRIKDGVWDTQAQAHLEFAGKLVRIEDGSPGIVTLTCRDLRADIESAVLLRDQWKGYVKPGITLEAGQSFYANETYQSAGTVFSATPMVVVASGATPPGEINAGLIELDDFLAALTAWVKADATLTADWTLRRQMTDQGYRTVVSATFPGGSTQRRISFAGTNFATMHFLGFEDAAYANVSAPYYWVEGESQTSQLVNTITSVNPPVRSSTFGAHAATTATVELSGSEGTWYTDLTYAPAFLKEHTGATSISYVRIGKSTIGLANLNTSTQLTKVQALAGFGQPFDVGTFPDRPELTFDDIEDVLVISQVVVLVSKFSTLIPRLIASIHGDGVNHANLDSLPWGAAIPYAVLGSLVASAKALEETGVSNNIAVILEKPTTLKDILLPELALRFAFLIFKGGSYQFVSPPVPNSITADHTLDETNKAIAGGLVPPSRSEWASDMMTNVIKVNHSRNLAGEYLGAPIMVKDQARIDVHGETQVVTIDAVNSMSDKSGIEGSTPAHLAAILAARLLPMFGQPIKVVTRSIAPSLYHIAPGDTVALSDDLVRDPTSGARGITGRACICLSVFHDYGHEGGSLAGEVTLLLSDEDRTFPLSPAAEIDTTYTSGLYTNGYDSTNFRIKILANAFSLSGTDAQDVTNFAAGDLIHIEEIDPANPSSTDGWNRTIAAVDETLPYIELTASISSPAWSGATKLFGVIAQPYASCQASQKLAAFQADDADGIIQNVAEPNGYGTSNTAIFTDADATDLPSLMPLDLAGDGSPITPLHLQSLAKMLNNLVEYKAAPHSPISLSANITSTSTTYAVQYIFPMFVGGYSRRYLSIAPMFFSDNAARTVSVRVTSSGFPARGAALTSITEANPNRSIVFTTTSTTAVVATAQDLLPVLIDGSGVTWLSVEMKISAAGTATLVAIPTLYLKAA